MDPVSAIGLASSILTFIDIGYKVVTGTLETAQTGRAPHTEHIDAVAHDLESALANFNHSVSPNPSQPEKALVEISIRCQALLKELLGLLEGFKVEAAKPGVSWDAFKVAIRRVRKNSKVQQLQMSLVEYRAEILVHLVTILNDRQLATQVQLINSFGELRTDLRDVQGVLDNFRTETFDYLEQAHNKLQSTTQSIPDTDEALLEHETLLNKLPIQLGQIKDALDRLAASGPEKMPETRILEHVYFGHSMFQREKKLDSEPAYGATFQWFVQGIASEGDSGIESMDSEEIDREEASSDLHAGALKVDVASRFENWLRSGSGVFHISGKAGSGKSTLMNLILSTRRTHELLTEWAGDKRLLFAHFYFWAGGDQMQNSLEGLQRSILFEILIHRPELVKQVFQEAYTIFAHRRFDSPVDSRFFTTASFQEAFNRLLNLPADPRYRLCLFIDGLDEYGADMTSESLPETQREDLAESLADWASNDQVKILVSSRPYLEFSYAFPQDQRVHLHQLTHHDMIQFGRHLFEKSRVLELPGVKERYQNLVEKVVRASEGVFLWTGLTIQGLITSLKKRDSFESLERQLETTPRGLKKLYHTMLSAIEDHEKVMAIKMMLLVSEERKYLGELSHPRGVNAMAISWLESLEQPEFPTNQPFETYTEDEVEERKRFAEDRVNGYTRGLLEVVTHIPSGDHFFEVLSPFQRHTVQFFHRTALEYVAESDLARNASSSSTMFNLKFYTRLSLTEFHFGSLQGWGGQSYHFKRYLYILRRYLSTKEPCRSLVEAYRAALERQARLLVWCNLWMNLGGIGPIFPQSRPDPSTSFDHWVANEVEETYAVQYLQERIRSFPELLRPRSGLSLLLSAACRQTIENLRFARLERVKMILELGADLHDTTYLRFGSYNPFENAKSMKLSVWQAWCFYYVIFKLETWRKERIKRSMSNFDTWQRQEDEDLDKILELFLKTSVDSDCYILMADNRSRTTEEPAEESDGETSEFGESEVDWESDEPAQHFAEQLHITPWTPADKWMRIIPERYQFKTAYVVSLGDFIRQAKPTNYERLEQLVGKSNLSQEFSTTKLRNIEAELATNRHPDFESPTVLPIDLEQALPNDSTKDLVVYWISWKDATIPSSLELRLY